VTPPCAQALVAAGVARVVVAAGDPDPRVAGRGLAMLREAGIAVETGVMEAEARADHAGFLLRVTEGRPFVTLKLAATLDGRIATAGGESRWITGAEARRMVHLLRAQSDAVMVGGGTARADDPELTVRDMGVSRQPVRVIVSRGMDLPPHGRLATTAREVPVWVAHDAALAGEVVARWTARGVEGLPCGMASGQVEPGAVLAALGARGITRVLCEGGGRLGASLLAAGLVDELVLFSAGMVIGAEGRPVLAALGVERLAHAPRLRLAEERAVGGDVMSRWTRT
jgi:diaminohydroxyphosphoribosylaminopyrimidine deaminase/5-amino-6-(5-phosphoribosylamino)uracil reductase